MSKYFAICLVFLFPLAATSQTPTFTSHTAANDSNYTIDGHTDMNGDGYEDLLLNSGSLISLSNGNGTYRTPVAVKGGGGTVVGDFNGDGKLDLASGGGSFVNVYLGNGDGTMQPVKQIPSGNQNLAISQIVAADVNHDNKTDLVLLLNSNNLENPEIRTLLSNGDGTFRQGPVTHFTFYGALDLLTGDFDGDGNADLAVWTQGYLGTSFEIFNGDGTGKFTESYGDSVGDDTLSVADVNGDHRSDLIGIAGIGDFVPYLTVYYGEANRSMTFAEIPTAGCPIQAQVADFNGDGIPDIEAEEDNCSTKGSEQNATLANVDILTGKGNGQFNPEASVYGPTFVSDAYPLDAYAIRGNRDTKADLIFEGSNSEGYPETYVALLNTTTGSFPTCAAPNAAIGISVCTPTAGSTVTSPVNFAAGAAGDTVMRKMEVWVDGKKQAQQLTGAFSNYSFINASVPMTSGSHKIGIVAGAWDGATESKTFTLNVAASSCSVPTSAGVHICTPGSGSTVSSPVQVESAAKVTGTLANVQLWVDGVKKYISTSDQLNTSVTLAAGNHMFGVIAANKAGQKWKTVVDATVK